MVCAFVAEEVNFAPLNYDVRSILTSIAPTSVDDAATHKFHFSSITIVRILFVGGRHLHDGLPRPHPAMATRVSANSSVTTLYIILAHGHQLLGVPP